MLDHRDIRTICLHCFSTLDKSGMCPRCHTRVNDRDNSPATLPQRTLLKGRYLLGKPLGIGGFGVTYLGWDMQCACRVAVKEFFPKNFAARDPVNFSVRLQHEGDLPQFEHWRKAFAQEGQILMMVRHIDSIVRIQDCFGANGTDYLVMDYLDGESLYSYLSRHAHKIPPASALKILRPVLDALVILHQYGVIHKDISPENIMIVQRKYVRLIDFGAAALYKQGTVIHPFMVLKSGYSPIELYPDSKYRQGPWSDVYQMGATLYHCVTGYIPAPAPQRLQKDLLPRPSSLGVSIPVAVENALMKSLQVLPEHRYQNVGEFIQMLYGEFMPPMLHKR